MILIICIYLPEPHCVGEYMIDVSPSQSGTNDDECKNREIVSAVVDKVIMFMQCHFGHC